jgi:hypothetical protein
MILFMVLYILFIMAKPVYGSWVGKEKSWKQFLPEKHPKDSSGIYAVIFETTCSSSRNAIHRCTQILKPMDTSSPYSDSSLVVEWLRLI